MAADMTEVRINTAGLIMGIKAAKVAFGGLDRVLSSIGDRLREAFSVKGYQDYKETVTRFGKELADQLLVMELSFGRMKYAIAEAVAPIASVFVPMLNTAIRAVIRFSGVVNQFLRGVIAGVTGNQNLTDTAEEAVRAEEKLGTAAKAARRALAGFDQLERLNDDTGSGSSGGEADLWGGFSQDPISPQVQTVVDKVLALLAPLMNINLKPLETALQSLGDAFSRMAAVAGDALGFLWNTVLAPFAGWVMEKLAPALAEGWAAKLTMVTEAMAPVVEGLQVLWEALRPVVNFIGEAVISALDLWRQHFLLLASVFQQKHPQIVGIFQNIAQIITQVWTVAGPVLSALGNHFGTIFGIISQTVGTTIGFILDMLYGLTTYLSGVFSGNWKQAWEGIRQFLKGAVNGVIALLNGMVSKLVAALNAVVRLANKLSFTVPDWVPSLGGKRFGVNLPYVSAPQIPYLAAGAVLPAGKPFLAMVGDQRHGTNIEAPLSTIQEAVALVMEDQTGAILRGFEASIGVQKEILQAVLGIQLGDELIGMAVSRYRRKLAVMKGG